MEHIKAKVAAGIVAAGLGVVAVMSPTGLEELKKHEGEVRTAYADPLHGWKVPTICYGSTKDVKRGDRATKAECDERLRQDVAAHCAIIDRALRGKNIALTQGEVDAYCSFAFNTGYFTHQRNGKITTMYRELLNGSHVAACNGLLLYTAGSDKAPGIKTRRAAEHQLCVSQL